MEKHPFHVYNVIKTVKFTDLFQEAKILKADALVTGHYVKSITKMR